MYPSLLKIIATHFPQLCIVCEILRERKDELGEWAGLGGGRSSYIKLCFYGTVKNAFQPVVKISKDIVNPEYARKSKYCTFRSQFLISTFHWFQSIHSCTCVFPFSIGGTPRSSLTSTSPPHSSRHPHTLTTHTLHSCTTVHSDTPPSPLSPSEDIGSLCKPLDQAQCTRSKRVHTVRISIRILLRSDRNILKWLFWTASVFFQSIER